MVHTIITFGLVLGLVLMVIGMITAKTILIASGTPHEILNDAMLYIEIYFISIPFMVIYNFGSAILRSVGDTRRPMYYLLISGVVNVALNLLLVIVFHLGVSGVAIGTVVSNIISAFLVMRYLCTRQNEFKFIFKDMEINKEHLGKFLQSVFQPVFRVLYSLFRIFSFNQELIRLVQMQLPVHHLH